MSNGWKAVRHRQENASKTWKAERKTEEEVLKEEKKTKTADLHLTQLIAVRQSSAALDSGHRGPCLRRFRTPTHMVFRGRIIQKTGPWHLSGHWWDHQRWLRTEWDIETEDQHLYRIFQRNGETFVEALYD